MDVRARNNVVVAGRRDGPVVMLSHGFGCDQNMWLLEDSVDDVDEHAPCGYLSTLLDGAVAKINATLLGWPGVRRDEVVGVGRIADPC